MAKRKQTEPDTDQPAKPKAFGIYLNKELAAEVQDIAAKETGGNSHALLQYALKYFIREYRAGRVKLKKRTVTKLELE